jgi:uncharacterized protein (TIGR03435 family)
MPIVCAAVTLGAQSPAPQPPSGQLPSFEVASVKVNRSGQMSRLFRPQPSGRFDATNMRLRDLIMFAYQVRPYQIEGGPDWMDSVSFDIVAKAEGDVGPAAPGGPPSPVALMMRSLLVDRFKLVVHNETREGPIYELTLARPDGELGPDFAPSTTDCTALLKAAMSRGGGPPAPPVQGDRMQCGMRISSNRIELGGLGMPELVNGLSTMLGRPVVNRTGLTGNYDLKLTFSPENIPGLPLPPGVQLPGADPNAPSIFTALQEQAGLRLESARGPVQMIVVDRAERPVED